MSLKPKELVKPKSLAFSLFFLVSLLLSSCGAPRATHPQSITREHHVFEYPKETRRGPQWKKLGPLIVVDAGHGGKDQGTHSDQPPRYQEKALTLMTSFLVEEYLRDMGYRTVMIRTDDHFVPLKKRASIANDLKAAAFVSVHYNSASNVDAKGIEVFYYKSDKNKSRTRQSQDLAKDILDEVIYATKAKSRGVKNGNFAVIRETDMPAVIIEGGFLTNAEERAKVLSAGYRRELAWGIALGVDEFMKKKR